MTDRIAFQSAGAVPPQFRKTPPQFRRPRPLLITDMDDDEVCDLIDQIDALLQTAESGEDWAEICRLETALVKARQRCREDHGQFGMGA